MTFFLEMYGIDSLAKEKNSNFLTLIYVYYMYFLNIKFIYGFSAYYNQPINSVSYFFQNAQWPERELSEMYGAFFFNKLDNRRLLLDYSFIGYPMIKIYPTIGFVEIIYSFIFN
jgi:NADH-quinone oxidoreductase subunit C